MSARRRSTRRASAVRRRDRRARLFGLTYLMAAAGLAVAHDRIVGLPVGTMSHAGEQIMLAGMLVLGVLGGLLLIEGSRLFDDALRRVRDRSRSDRSAPTDAIVSPATSRTEPAPIDSGAWDTRYGVAMVLAQRAIAASAKQPRAPQLPPAADGLQSMNR